MNTSFKELRSNFVALGGIAENVSQREGAFGRGIFPVDHLLGSKIVTPKNLLVDADNLRLVGGNVVIKDSSNYTGEEIAFLEMYYNDYSWGNGGNRDSASFLKYVLSMTETTKKQLLAHKFIDSALLSYGLDNDSLLKRFVSERCVRFRGRTVLAPVWEFVNHSSFAAPLRATHYGVETPPINPSSSEILFKYSAKNSPMNMWKKYGFACDCIVAYSVPFDIRLNNKSIAIKCCGQLGLGPKEKANVSIDGDTVVIKSLPVGCLSVALPQEYLKNIMTSMGFPIDVSNHLFLEILEINLKARSAIIASLDEPLSSPKSQLHKALSLEIELIRNSSTN